MSFSSSNSARSGRLIPICLGLCLALGSGQALAFSQLVVIGDSLSDTGNILTSTFGFAPAPPYVDGRLTNGPNWVDGFAASLGLSSQASLQGGTNYAYGGARTGPTGGSPPTLLDQVNQFLGATGGTADADALYVVFGGGNDVRDGVAGSTVANLGSVIMSLAGAGAATFLVPNVPDIGRTPEALGDGSSAAATATSIAVNAALATELDLLRTSLAVQIYEFDLFGFLNNAIANPASYGFTNVDTACYDGLLGVGIGGPGTVCSNPDEYLFWDAFHPTTVAHQYLGEAMAAVIPLPSALWLLMSALAVLGWRRRGV